MADTRKLFVVVKREFLERVRTKWFVISTVAIPLLLGATTVLPIWLAMKTTASSEVSQIAILDATGSDLGQRVARVLTSDSARAAGAAGPQVRTIDPASLASAEQGATQEVMKKAIPGYVVLTAATVRGDSARYAGRNASSVADVERISRAVRQAVVAQRLERAGLQGARVDSLTQVKLAFAAERIGDQGKSGRGGFASYAVGLIVAFALYMSIAIYGQMVLRGVMEEKTTRVAEVVVSSIKPETLMAGKVLGVAGVGLLQLMLWAGGTAWIGAQLAPFLTRMMARGGGAAAAGAASPPPGSTGGIGQLLSMGWETVAVVLVFFVLGFLLFATLYAAAGATVSSEQDAQQAATPIALLLIPSVVMVQPIAMNPASSIARIFSFIPFSAPVIMPLRMTMVQVPAWEVAVSIAVTLATVAAAIWFAGRVYRVGLLMYGKRPSIPELLRWVRQAA